MSAAGNCSGCGLCSLLDPHIEMGLDSLGFNRPIARSHHAEEPEFPPALDIFEASCPGVRVRARQDESAIRDSTFGPAVSTWEAWAADADQRFAGSSGGTITALASWFLGSGIAHRVTGARSDETNPRRTVPISITSRDEALGLSGSRYAPVSALANPDVLKSSSVVIGKPCEASALRQALDTGKLDTGPSHPVILSFFCAGVPSQSSTDELIRTLGLDPELVSSLRYRGQGWPGDFVASDEAGQTVRTTYQHSWGTALGPTMQWRCKICPDGVGESADIVAGDFWRTDADGYPAFDSQDGVSVLIARTRRGHDLLMEAVAAEAICARPMDISSLYPVQPLQVERRQQLFGRMIGARLAGQRPPRYLGFGLLRLGLRNPYRRILRPLLGTLLRARRGRRRRDSSTIQKSETR